MKLKDKIIKLLGGYTAKEYDDLKLSPVSMKVRSILPRTVVLNCEFATPYPLTSELADIEYKEAAKSIAKRLEEERLLHVEQMPYHSTSQLYIRKYEVGLYVWDE